MQLEVKHFLLINAAIVGLIVVSFYIRAKSVKKGPSRLKMDRAQKDMQSQRAQEPRDPEQPLNVIFVYNGHSWDAYEVLGVPAGSSMSVVEKAYHAALDDNDSAAHDFINKAYSAIQES